MSRIATRSRGRRGTEESRKLVEKGRSTREELKLKIRDWLFLNLEVDNLEKKNKGGGGKEKKLSLTGHWKHSKWGCSKNHL